MYYNHSLRVLILLVVSILTHWLHTVSIVVVVCVSWRVMYKKHVVNQTHKLTIPLTIDHPVDRHVQHALTAAGPLLPTAPDCIPKLAARSICVDCDDGCVVVVDDGCVHVYVMHSTHVCHAHYIYIYIYIHHSL